MALFPPQLTLFVCIELTRLAYYNDLFVGAIAARYEKSETGTRIYIMTIGVLAPYRHLGIASKLLAHVERVAAEGTKHKVDEVTLHAWVANEDGIAFYKKVRAQCGSGMAGPSLSSAQLPNGRQAGELLQEHRAPRRRRALQEGGRHCAATGGAVNPVVFSPC